MNSTSDRPSVAPPDTDLAVHQLFEVQVTRTPQAIAVRMGEQTLTYEALNRHANQLARHLIQQGVVGDRPVALLMDRGLSCLVALLAVMKSGAAYVPLDLTLPMRRVSYILLDSGATCLLVDRGSRDRIETLPSDGLALIDVDATSIYRGEDHNLDLAVDPSHEVYCIYTSGSTGEPKGVMVHHAGLTNYVTWARRQYVGDDVRTFALYSSLSFDLTITSIFVPLVCGRTIVVYPEPDDDVPLVIRVVKDDQVDVLKLTPAHLALIHSLPLDRSRLKVLILGGEDLKGEHAFEVHCKLGGRAAIYNEYGPTETVVGCMIYRYDPLRDARGSVPIGLAIDGMRIKLVDDDLRPVRHGEIGQIAIGGVGLSLGYRNKPEATARQFVADPSMPGERLYLSGDLGKADPRGGLVYLGRQDFQIKLRGYRVELGEVESWMLTFPGVRECTVVTTKTAQRNEYLPLLHCARCGLASSFPNTTFTANGICNHCIAYERFKPAIDAYFGTMDQFDGIVAEMRAAEHPRYDCLVAFSGGKDSTYALCRMVDMGVRVLAFTLDNGYISDSAKQNIASVVSRLGIEHRYIGTEYMNEVFVDSLRRHSNVCNGCFKTIYTLGINLAHEISVRHIVMGLSRGQLLETRLGELTRTERFDPIIFERNLLNARRLYHRIDDAVARHLDVSCVGDDAILSSVRFVDFYRYCYVGRHEMYDYIRLRVGWIRPIDTGRSTNCLINDVGIYVHNRERKYHNYALPYSWDVRLGHIPRDEALHELDDSEHIDVRRVETIMSEIGYELNDKVVEAADAQLVAYYVADEAADPEALRAHLRQTLPDYMVPLAFVCLDRLPLTPNGKVNRQALPKPEARRGSGASGADVPATDLERALADLWKEVLMIEQVGLNDSFFELGGHSLPALMLLYRIDEQFGTTIGIQDFAYTPTIADLARRIKASANAREAGVVPAEGN